MKILFKSFLMPFVFITALSCKAQLVQAVDDVKKININKQEFIDKNLKTLLKQIKPEIQRVRYIPSAAPDGLGTLYLAFLPDSSFRKYWKENGKSPAEIRIKLKENDFKWDPSGRPEGHRFDWTNADAEAFGKLTVVDVKVNSVN